jgi:hypothetical protein
MGKVSSCQLSCQHENKLLGQGIIPGGDTDTADRLKLGVKKGWSLAKLQVPLRHRQCGVTLDPIEWVRFLFQGLAISPNLNRHKEKQ